MYVATVPNRNSPPAILVRKSYREGGKVKTMTLANITKLPPEAIEAVRQSLKGNPLVPLDQLLEVVPDGSRQLGNVQAALGAMKRLEFAKLLHSRPSRERDIVQAVIAAQILKPNSKLAMTRWWDKVTLAGELGVGDADEDDIYAAMEWLLKRQPSIEKSLANRHLESGGLALFDLTSSYFEGVTCPLAKRGHNRDGKKGKLQVNYGLLTNQEGIPVSVSVFEGNVGDPKTLLPQVTKLRDEFGLNQLILVGDRGMIKQKQIDAIHDMEGMDWITALGPAAVKRIAQQGAVQMGLFDERNLIEIEHPDFSGERLMVCRNPSLAERRAAKRESLLEATVDELEKVRSMVNGRALSGREAIEKSARAALAGYKAGRYFTLDVREDGFTHQVDEDLMIQDIRGRVDDSEKAAKRIERQCGYVRKIELKLENVRERTLRGKLYGRDLIGLRIGKVINKYKVAKHFKLEIQDALFEYEIDEESVAAEKMADGIYIVRTSVEKERLGAEDVVRGYKSLSNVEKAFRCLKDINLAVRPIHHRLETRVKAHIFLCMLAYYVKWHMMEAWRPLLFSDEDQEAKKTRDPVMPAKRSESAKKKVQTKRRQDGGVVHSFRTLLAELSAIVRNTCRRSGAAENEPAIYVDTQPNPTQRKALALIDGIRVGRPTQV